MQELFGVNSSFYRFMWKTMQILWLNIIWIICCIPVFTIGAANTALYYTSMKLSKNEESYITKDFFHSFRQNFRQATIIWLILMSIGLVLFINVFYYWVLYDNTNILLVLFGILIFFYFIIFTYIFPALAKFENSIINTFHFSAIMSIRKIGWTLLLIFVEVAVIVLSIALHFIPFLIGAGLIAYFQSFIFEYIFADIIKNTI